MNIKLQKLNPYAKTPTYGSSCSAGADLYAATEDNIDVQPGETVIVPTGIAVEIPDGYVGLVYARSGIATKKGLAPANKVGVIDSDYRGELKVVLYNHSSAPAVVESGERIAQLIITPYLKCEFTETDSLSDTARGGNGFGSTGR